MLFNSLDFVLFFPFVVALYFALPYRARMWFLLGASYYFYGSWKAEYLLLLLLSTVVDYGAGIMMGRYEEKRQRRPWLYLSLTVNLGLLSTFKYSGMFAETANALFGWLEVPYEVPILNVLLPVGISFYTFQTLAYSIDVYRGRQAAERSFLHFALYVTFFPQLVAGPIERSQNLLPQFYERHRFNYDRAVSGLRLMMGGFLMKLCVADQVAPFVFEVWGQPGTYFGTPVLLANFFFCAQMYCDFAGYSLIAIGSARVMGYDLMMNFDRPFFSTTVNEFWRRWHISLMTWFRDYLWTPLNGGGRVSKERGLFSLFVVFVLSGLWHGARWTFVLWGTLHGLALIIGNLTRKRRNKTWKRLAGWEAALRRGRAEPVPVRAAGVAAPRLPLLVPKLQHASGVFWTFAVFYFLGGFFVARSLADWPVMALSQFQLSQSNFSEWVLAVSPYRFILCLVGLGALIAVEFFQGRHKLDEWIAARPWYVRWAIYFGGFAFILLFGATGGQNFIYFQF
jgi:alginate O-acetyltransferase complex protein AlgI